MLKMVVMLVFAVASMGCQALIRAASTEEQQNYRVDLFKRVVSTQGANAPRPVRQIQVPVGAIDDLRVMSRTRVLASTLLITGLNDPISFAEYGPYVAFDLPSGRALWNFQRASDYEHHQWGILATHPVVLVQHQAPDQLRLVALDPETGAKRWEGSHAVGARVQVEGSVVLILSKEGGGRLTQRDLATGSQHWIASLPVSRSQPMPVMVKSAEGVLVMGTKAQRYSSQSGKLKWQVPDVGPPSAPPVLLPQGVVVGSANRITLISPTGSVVWTSSTRAVRAMACNADACVVETRANRGSVVSRRALSDGTRQWEVTVTGSLHSPLLLAGSRVAYTVMGPSGARFEMLDAMTGAAVRSESLQLPTATDFAATERLPDSITLHGSRIVVSAEVWAGAFDSGDGRQLWQRSLSPTFTFSGAVRQAGMGAGKPGAGPATQPLQAPVVLDAHDGVRWAEQHRANTYQATAAAIDSGSSADRIDASTDRAMADQSLAIMRDSDAAWERSMANVALLNAGISGVAAAQEAGRAYVAEERQRADRLMRPRAIPQAVRDHLAAVKGRFLVRPVTLKGGGLDGVLVIDLESGKSAEVPTNTRHRSVYRNLLQCELLPNGKAFVATGIGMDPTRWQIDSTLTTERQVRPTIQVFDLTTLKLQ